MKSVEARLGIAGPERTKRKGEQALDRLRTIAGRGGTDAALVVALLESAADTAESHSTISALPSAERDLWTSVGARFDKRARLKNDRRLVGAFGALLARSVVGDTAMAELLGVDRSRVSQRLADRSLYAFTAGEERCFPRWQLIDGKPFTGLKVVLRATDPALHPLTVDHWFTTPNVDLEIDDEPVSPVTWLATGGAPQAAADLAADL
jgi:hypothetical protein